MITDLIQIRTLGEKKRGENEGFRRHMKSRVFLVWFLCRIAEDIEGQIDCTVCANCCKVASVQLSERDVERLAKSVGTTRARFLADYTMQSESEGMLLKRSKQTGCVFLNGKDCTVYDARPEICQKFPHLVRGQGSIASRMWQFVDRACYCPIVYNALEAFKEELRFQK